MCSGQLEHEHNPLTVINHDKGPMGFIALSFVEKATFLPQFISLKTGIDLNLR